MPQRSGDRQSLDALCPPFGLNVGAGYTPYFFGVIFEKGQVQFTSKTVDEEIFEIFFRFDGKKAGPNIAEANDKHTNKTQVKDSPQIEA